MCGEIREFIDEKMVDYLKDICFVNDLMFFEIGGVFKNVEEYVSDDFLVIYGDVFINFNFRELIEVYRNNDGLIMVVVIKVYDLECFGVVEIDENGKVIYFEEKFYRLKMNFVDVGIYVVNKKVFEEILKGKEVYFEREVLLKFVVRGEVYVYRMFRDVYWVDFGIFDDFFYVY